MTNEEFIESIRLENEEWRPVVGWEESYMISSIGRVVSLGRLKTFSNRKGCFTKPHIKIQTLGFGNDSYYVVQLRYNNKFKSYKTHRLVAMSFIPNPNNYPEVDHINRDTKDNRVCNLRWCSHKMNMNNENSVANFSSIRKGIRFPSRWKSVVSLKDGAFIKKYNSMSDTRSDGFSPHVVSKVCKGVYKQHFGYTFMFLSDYEKLLSSSDVKELSQMQSED